MSFASVPETSTRWLYDSNLTSMNLPCHRYDVCLGKLTLLPACCHLQNGSVGWAWECGEGLGVWGGPGSVGWAWECGVGLGV